MRAKRTVSDGCGGGVGVAGRGRVTQIAVHEVDAHRAFADCGGHALHRAAAEVAGGEDAGQAGLQRQAVAALALPQFGNGAGLCLRAGEHEAARVEGERAGQPIGVRVGAGEDEQGPHLEVAVLARTVVDDGHRLEGLVAECLGHLGVQQHAHSGWCSI